MYLVDESGNWSHEETDYLFNLSRFTSFSFNFNSQFVLSKYYYEINFCWGYNLIS